MYSIGAIDDEPLIIKFHELYTDKVNGYVWKGSANTLASGKEMILNKKIRFVIARYILGPRKRPPIITVHT
ncbi:hypothetical protein [Geomicrobium sp. JCM 19055]|uniref:hypothetical protein n=1 Tax=Geomicrobium sp. JCM 19055 TaxID=1460649 RepID=UPI000694F37F|nr:hypothetical protein [Geomicrobium sp. JCM 19055]